MTPPFLTDAEIKAVMKRLEATNLLSLLQGICREYNVTLEGVLRKRRTRRIVYARDACCHRLHSLGLSTVEVGRHLEMDHTSVSQAVRRYKTRDNGRALT